LAKKLEKSRHAKVTSLSTIGPLDLQPIAYQIKVLTKIIPATQKKL
jgi:hypothetical protein